MKSYKVIKTYRDLELGKVVKVGDEIIITSVRADHINSKLGEVYVELINKEKSQSKGKENKTK